MRKYDLTDVSFLIPVKIDSIIRMENLLVSINSLLTVFDTNIYVVEVGKYNNHILPKILPQSVCYMFIESYDPIFHRTHYINLAEKESVSPYLVIWDADVIISPSQIKQAVRYLRKGKADIVFPYDGRFFDTTSLIRELYMRNNSIEFLQKFQNRMLLPYGTQMGGGAVFISRRAFEYSGKEDERFYGWGPEDWNRIEKWKVLKLHIQRTKGPLFHLTHPRDINGRHSSQLQRLTSFLLLNQTENSSASDLLKLISQNTVIQ